MDKSNTKSFTLIEILIVTTIIAVLSGTSMALFSTYRDDKVLAAQVSILTRVLELAKNKATAGDTSLCSNSQNAHVDGYTVSVDPLNITLLPGCDTIPTPLIYPIPTTILYPTPSFSFRFDSRNYQGGTEKYPIKNRSTNKCKFVQIDETGLITNGDYTTCP
jgi:prepilin-type N-terminal cleavage/methylation domain-containing protein